MAEHIFNFNKDGVLLKATGEDDSNQCSFSFDTTGKSQLDVSDQSIMKAENEIRIMVHDAVISCHKEGLDIKFKESQCSLNQSGMNVKIGDSQLNISSSGIEIKTTTLKIDAQNIEQTAKANCKISGANTQIEGKSLALKGSGIATLSASTVSIG
ncbi:type VI secretion system tip protein TssI/VgrG [Facilibium subflavum]|uniref:type VI secretion system tip protein TssI/VgrG n=1 Tax=Facilibium subflavum TaxID=2219058 RepID=UPI000E65A3BC|nr:type VI secretion system tip protein TssI/VgrG [Facilibium subflavum]